MTPILFNHATCSVRLSVYLSLSETFFRNDKLVSSTARSKIVIT